MPIGLAGDKKLFLSRICRIRFGGAGRDQEKLDDTRTDTRQTLASLRRAEIEELCVMLGRRGRLNMQRERGLARLVSVV